MINKECPAAWSAAGEEEDHQLAGVAAGPQAGVYAGVSADEHWHVEGGGGGASWGSRPGTYKEDITFTPVVSYFHCFLLGTHGVNVYEPFHKQTS